MLRKFFPLDKNYLLEKAHLDLKDQLLFDLFEMVQKTYQQERNPLGLTDDFSVSIKNYKLLHLEALEEFYYKLAGVYRFKWGDSQLEFVWDGREHIDKYKQDWTLFFREAIAKFCRQPLFVQAVLDVTIFLPAQSSDKKQIEVMETRMQQFMMQQFGVTINKNKGLVLTRVA